MALPWIATMASPTCKPPRCPGPSGPTSITTMAVVPCFRRPVAESTPSGKSWTSPSLLFVSFGA